MAVSSRRRRVPSLVLLAVFLVVAAGAGGWALSTVLRPAEDPLSIIEYALVTVEQGEVSESLQLNTVASWASEPEGVNQASGVVTEVSVPAGGEASQNTVLYTVDLRPVVAAEGETPSFRVMKLGDEGEDVAQLQRMLTDAGLYAGDTDGSFGAGTVVAVKAWQESLGLEASGVVEKGDVVFVPSLPTRITVDAEVVSSGKTLTGGEEVLRVLPDAPSFAIPVSEAQANMIPTGTAVTMSSPEGEAWSGVTGERRSDPQSQETTIIVEADADTPICANACGQVSVGGETLLESEIVTVPAAQGLVVPSAAIVTGAGGGTALVDEAGDRIPVTVVASARGMSVVEGANDGLRVRVPGES